MRMVPRNVPEEGVHHGEPRCVVSDCVHRAEVERLRAEIGPLRQAASCRMCRASIAGCDTLMCCDCQTADDERVVEQLTAEMEARHDDLRDEVERLREEADAQAQAIADLNDSLLEAERQLTTTTAIAIRLAREVSEPKLRRAGLDDLEATVPGSTDGLDERLMPREE